MKGDQVFIYYGKYSNPVLLVEYGFILNNNIYNNYPVPYNHLNEMLKLDKLSIKKFGFLVDNGILHLNNNK